MPRLSTIFACQEICSKFCHACPSNPNQRSFLMTTLTWTTSPWMFGHHLNIAFNPGAATVRWRFRSEGCFKPANAASTDDKFFQKTFQKLQFTFPPDLASFHLVNGDGEGPTTPASLTALCLQVVHTIYRREGRQTSQRPFPIMPSNLKQVLYEAPPAICIHCERPIYEFGLIRMSEILLEVPNFRPSSPTEEHEDVWHAPPESLDLNDVL